MENAVTLGKTAETVQSSEGSTYLSVLGVYRIIWSSKESKHCYPLAAGTVRPTPGTTRPAAHHLRPVPSPLPSPLRSPSELTLEMVSGALKSLPPTKRKPHGEGPRRTTEWDIAAMGRSLPAGATSSSSHSPPPAATPERRDGPIPPPWQAPPAGRVGKEE